MYDVEFITSRALALDDVRYALSVYQSAEGFMAFWECEDFPNSGQRTGATMDRDQAIEECERAINNYHARNHPALAVASADD
jgi:hypothetical protein